MTRANVLRLGFGAVIALGVLFDGPATSESVTRDGQAAAVSEAIGGERAAEAAIAEAAVAAEESCSARARADRFRRDAARQTRKL